MNVKRFLSVLIVFSLVVGMVLFPAPFSSVVQAAETYTVSDDFNITGTGSAPTGWTTNTAGGTVNVQEVPFAGDKSVMISKSGTANDASATKTFMATSGKVVVEAKVKSMETTGYKCALYVYAADGTTNLASIAFGGGNIKSYVGSTLTTIQPFTADTWYIIRAILNTNTKTYDLYIDGVKVLSNASFRDTAGSNVGEVFFNIGNGYSGTMYFDDVNVWEVDSYIGAPVGPIYDVNSYGAIGDGVTKNTAAIQAAINAVPASGGTVYLHDGTFMSGTIKLKSNITLYIDDTATLKAVEGPLESPDFPYQNPPTTNSQLSNCRRGFIYAESANNIKIDGGGTIDGNGSLSQYKVYGGGTEAKRPIMFFAVLCTNVTIQNVYFKDGATWGIVPMECDYVTIQNIYENTTYPGNKDGIDIVDGSHILIQNCTIKAEDDVICPKSGIRRGVDDLTVKNVNICYTKHNGLKFGTAAYGAFKNSLFEDIMMKNTELCAMNLESTDGADISNITFRRIDVENTGALMFIIIEDRGIKPSDDVRKIGSVNGVNFTDIKAKNFQYGKGNPIIGFIKDGVTYKVKNVSLTNVTSLFKGGAVSIPADPAEPSSGYPEYQMFGNLPSYGPYFRHVDGLSMTNCNFSTGVSDVREAVRMVDTGSDFESGQALGWTTNGGTWSVFEDGSKVYGQSDINATNVSSVNGISSLKNYEVQASVKAASFNGTAGIGLDARYQDANNLYNFQYYTNGGIIKIQKCVEGTWTTLASKAYTFNTGTWYQIKAITNGSSLEFWVNGVKELTATDTSFTTGKFGLYSHRADARFDNVIVTSK